MLTCLGCQNLDDQWRKKFRKLNENVTENNKCYHWKRHYSSVRIRYFLMFHAFFCLHVYALYLLFCCLPLSIISKEYCFNKTTFFNYQNLLQCVIFINKMSEINILDKTLYSQAKLHFLNIVNIEWWNKISEVLEKDLYV